MVARFEEIGGSGGGELGWMVGSGERLGFEPINEDNALKYLSLSPDQQNSWANDKISGYQNALGDTFCK